LQVKGFAGALWPPRLRRSRRNILQVVIRPWRLQGEEGSAGQQLLPDPGTRGDASNPAVFSATSTPEKSPGKGCTGFGSNAFIAADAFQLPCRQEKNLLVNAEQVFYPQQP
jgi:hypothetical protein